MRRLSGGTVGLALLLLLAAWGGPIRLAAAAGEEQVRTLYAKYADRMFSAVPDASSPIQVYEGAPGEPLVDCAGIVGPRTMVALVFGQSNVANTVEPGYESTQPVFAWHNGQCQRVHDALPGATSDMGSSLSRLGDRLVASGLYESVLFIDIARGGSSILNWGPLGDLNPLLLRTIDTLTERGLPPTQVLFHQGEADCALGIAPGDYKVLLGALLGQIRSHVSPSTDIFLSRASVHLGLGCADRRNPGCYKSCPEIVAAQTELADPSRRIFSGPNTDLLVPWFDRRDGYHFTAQGADRFAAAWMPLLVPGGAMPRPGQ
jgi:hypothetical protein